MKFLLPFVLSAFPLAAVAQSQSPTTPPTADPPFPRTTEVMVILTAKQGVTRQQIMAIMPAEIRATVKLYLDGKIRQWYSRGDGRGVVFMIDAQTGYIKLGDFSETSAKEVGDAVVKGEVEFGILPVSEILPIKGAEILAPFPADVQSYIVMIGGASAASKHGAAAKELLSFFMAPAAVPVIKAKGMER